jgi:hypothetical protein
MVVLLGGVIKPARYEVFEPIQSLLALGAFRFKRQIAPGFRYQADQPKDALGFGMAVTTNDADVAGEIPDTLTEAGGRPEV